VVAAFFANYQGDDPAVTPLTLLDYHTAPLSTATIDAVLARLEELASTIRVSSTPNTSCAPARARGRRFDMARSARSNPGGRKSSYDPDVAAAICMQLIEGRSLRSICKDEGRPHVDTFFEWLNKHEDLRARYVLAKDIQGHMIYEEGIAIVDAVKGATTQEEIQVAKLRSDARFRWAGKVLPKVYGDKLLHTGADGEGPVAVKLSLDYTLLEPHEMLEFRRMLAKMERKGETPMIEGAADDDAG
jgi:hypothetical protein